ncbi:hypothetical protein M5K25_011895 [Dendrobium thyrsiflorum]|uniref:DYW domain-containing protein n=1 Tax=Dendrobium thyrsiflorum TaxID=117978 RepID=A0ABD0VB88_DENTH
MTTASAVAFQAYFPYLIRSLKNSSSLASVTSAHSKFLKAGIIAGTTTANHFINGYLRCGSVSSAQQMFDEMVEPNVVSWTSLMAGYVEAGQANQAIFILQAMPMDKIEPNSFTISTAINACSQLANVRIGKILHGRIELLGLQSDVVASTSLINMYGKTNDVYAARQVFDGMSQRNIYTWGTIVSVYAQNACGNEALYLFRKFSSKMRPNHFMLSSVINSCAGLGRFGPGRSAHAAVIRLGHEDNDVIAGGLIDMYAKCGCVEYSRVVFNHIEAPTLIPFTSMIVSAARHGLSGLALLLFDKMLDLRIQPNSITLLGVLHACSHSGLSDTGLSCLNSMHHNYDIPPNAKHYTCAVDMLARAGRIDEALMLACQVDASGHDRLMLWSVLVSAARMKGRLDVVDKASAQMSNLEPGQHDAAGIYVAMSNAYISAGKYDGAWRVRKEMQQRGIRKDPGCSWIEVKNLVFVFYAGNIVACPRKEEVIGLLGELEERMAAEMGYKRSFSSYVEFDNDGLGVERLMAGVHSEMLAMAFGILSFPNGRKIRIMKNLRMCGECHLVFKVVSKLEGKEFVVRDLNRFHHFKDGICSCRDYW